MKRRILVPVAVILFLAMIGLGAMEQNVNASGAMLPTFRLFPTFIIFHTPTSTPKVKIILTFIKLTLIVQPPIASNTPLPSNTTVPTNTGLPTNTLPGPTQTPIVVTATFQMVPTRRTVFATWTPSPQATGSCPGPVIVYQSNLAGNTHIRAYFTGNSVSQDLTPGIAGQAIHPRITPDGQYVFYTLQNGTTSVPYLIPLCGGAPQQVSDQGGEAVWTSNGLVLVVGDEAFIINLFDPNPTLKDLGVSCHEPDPSPDGTLIACVGPNNQILVATTNPGTLYKLPISGHYPRWRPDGKGLVYSALMKGDQLLDFGTGNSTAISSNPNSVISDLVYNPSIIKQIAAVAGNGITVIATDNSLSPQTITQVGETGLSPDWWTGNHILVDMSEANSYLSRFKQ